MFPIHLCCFDMHELLLAQSRAFNQGSPLSLVWMFTDGVKGRKTESGRIAGREGERDGDVGGVEG